MNQHIWLTSHYIRVAQILYRPLPFYGYVVHSNSGTMYPSRNTEVTNEENNIDQDTHPLNK